MAARKANKALAAVRAVEAKRQPAKRASRPSGGLSGGWETVEEFGDWHLPVLHPTRPCPQCGAVASPDVGRDNSLGSYWACAGGHRFAVGPSDARLASCIEQVEVVTAKGAKRSAPCTAKLQSVGPFLVCPKHQRAVWPLVDGASPISLCPEGQKVAARLARFTVEAGDPFALRDGEVPFGYTDERWAEIAADLPAPTRPDLVLVVTPSDDDVPVPASHATLARPRLGEESLFPLAEVPVEVKRKTVNALSPSSASVLAQCPRRFEETKVLGKQEPVGRAATLGKFVHKVLELLTARPLPERTEDAARLIARRLWADVDRDPDAAVEYREADESDVRELRRDRVALNREVADVPGWVRQFKGESWAALAYAVSIEEAYGGEVAYREMNLWDTHVGGVPFRGYGDRIDRHRTATRNGLVIVDYKGLPLDTPIPTPTGWTTMAELGEGDEVFGSDGRPCRVVAKSAIHEKPCLRLVLDDGSSMVCDDEHLWNVLAKPHRGPGAGGTGRAAKTVSAVELAALSVTHYLRIDNSAPLDLPEAALPIDPYVLGCWLGDGKSTAGEITIGDTDVGWFLDEFERLGESWTFRNEKAGSLQVTIGRPDRNRCLYGHESGFFPPKPSGRGTHGDCRECSRRLNARYYVETNGWRPGRRERSQPIVENGWPSNGSLGTRLGSLGVLGNKHVPAVYLRASADQRLALLQGLMDTDGSWNPQRGMAVFVSTSPSLANAVYDLVCGLGWRASMFRKGYAAKAGPRVVHMVGFNPDVPVFRLPRKAELHAPATRPTVQAGRPVRRTYRRIRRMERVETVATQCIVVDSPDSTYLCGPQMLPTHNSGKPPLDKRTGKIDPGKLDEKGEQLLLYSAPVEQKTGEKVIGALLAYIGVGAQVVLWVDDAKRAQAEAKLQRLWRDLGRFELAAQEKGERYPAHEGYLCGWCPFFEDCQPGSAWLLSEFAATWMQKREARGEPTPPAMVEVQSWPRERRQAWWEMARS